MKAILFCKRIFADVIKWRLSKWNNPGLSWWALNSIIILIRNGEDRDTQGKGHVKMECAYFPLFLDDFLKVLKCPLCDFFKKKKKRWLRSIFLFFYSMNKFSVYKMPLVSHLGDPVFYEHMLSLYECCFRIYQDDHIVFFELLMQWIY